MTDDPQDQDQQYNNSDDDRGNSGGGGGIGGGGLFQLLPLLLGLFRGKGIILLLVILGGGYFLLGRGGCNPGSGGSGGGNSVIKQIAGLATGGFLDRNQFEKANIYEPLTDDDGKNPLPESANLQKFAPAVGDQGKQGSAGPHVPALLERGAQEVEAGRQDQDAFGHDRAPARLGRQVIGG